MTFCGMNDVELRATQGKTFYVEFQWAQPQFIYKGITAIANSAPVTITATAHDMPNGWRFAVSAVQGMTELNASADPPIDEDWFIGTVIDADTIAINTINGALLSAYTSDGFIQYHEPVDLTGYEARIEIRESKGGRLLWGDNSETGDLTVDNAEKKISVRIPPGPTAGFQKRTYVFEIEMYNGVDVFTLANGTFVVSAEIAEND